MDMFWPMGHYGQPTVLFTPLGGAYWLPWVPSLFSRGGGRGTRAGTVRTNRTYHRDTRDEGGVQILSAHRSLSLWVLCVGRDPCRGRAVPSHVRPPLASISRLGRLKRQNTESQNIPHTHLTNHIPYAYIIESRNIPTQPKLDLRGPHDAKSSRAGTARSRRTSGGGIVAAQGKPSAALLLSPLDSLDC